MLQFRDKIARKEDESLTYVLSNRAMFYILEHKPKTVEKLLKKVRCLGKIGKKYAYEIIRLIKGKKAFSDTLFVEEKKQKKKKISKKKRTIEVFYVDY